MIIYRKDVRRLRFFARISLDSVRLPSVVLEGGRINPAEFGLWGDKSKMNPTQAELLESYARDFSEIEGLQHAHRVGYALYGRAGSLGVVVCREAGPGASKAARCALRNASEEFGRNLLRFLYENAIPPENACDVIRDVCDVAAECAV